jgi:uncharacterized protein YcnI
MSVRAVPIIAAAAAVFISAPVAAAHVTVNPREWEAGGFAKFDVRVPNERDNADTTKVVVRFPEQILSASFEPVPGWKRTVKMATLDEPIDDEGEQITERIDTVTWSGNRIRPGEFQEFPVSFQVPEEQPGTELAFPAIQTYSNGETVRWIGPADADQPAPIVAVTEAAPAEEEAAATPVATQAAQDTGGGTQQEDESGGSDTLSIIALIVGIAALAVGLVAIFMRGGRKSESAASRTQAPV